MKPGFTLIELILAFMFSTIILTVLFTSFFQINRSSLMTEDVIDMNTYVLTIHKQLEKDLSGAFVPMQAIPQKEKEEEKEAPKKDEAAQKKEKASALPPPPKKEKKAKPKLLNDVFYSSNKNELLNELTFISNNPMRVYEYAENAQIKPYVVRIVYRLIPDPDKKGSFKLMRQEDTQLDFNMYKKDVAKQIKAYELASHIKKLTIEFTAPVPKEEPKKEQKDEKLKQDKQKSAKETKAKKAEPVKFETKKEWRSDELRNKKPAPSQLPQFITIKVTVWDNQYEHDRTFTFNYTIPAFGGDVIKEKPEEPKKDEKAKKDEEAKKEKEDKAAKNAVAQQKRYRPTIAELRSSINDFVNMLNRNA